MHNTHLDKLIPSCTHNHRILRVRAKPYAADPFRMSLVRNRKLAVSQRVPQLDGLVARARDDLAIVGGEGYGEDVVIVAHEAARRGACRELPQAQGFVPRSGEGVGAVGGDHLEGVGRVSE